MKFVFIFLSIVFCNLTFSDECKIFVQNETSEDIIDHLSKNGFSVYSDETNSITYGERAGHPEYGNVFILTHHIGNLYEVISNGKPKKGDTLDLEYGLMYKITKGNNVLLRYQSQNPIIGKHRMDGIIKKEKEGKRGKQKYAKYKLSNENEVKIYLDKNLPDWIREFIHDFYPVCVNGEIKCKNTCHN